MAHAISQLRETRSKAISMLKMDRFLADANWDMVEKYTFIVNPYHTKDMDDKVLLIDEFLYPSMRHSTCPECNSKVFNEPTPNEQFEMANDARVRYLKTEKISYWRQFEHGMISADAVRTLVGSTEVAADMEGAFLSIDELRKSWEVRGVFAWMRQRLESVAKTTELDEDEQDLPQAKFRQVIYHKLVNTTWFEVLVYSVILLNMVLMILEYTTWYGASSNHDHDEPSASSTVAPHSTTQTPIMSTAPGLNSSASGAGRAVGRDDTKEHNLRQLELLRFGINIFFFVFYVAEAVLKVLGLGFCNYWHSHWNKLDFAVVLLSVADIVFEICDMVIREGVDEKYKILSPAILRNIRFLRLFRLTRVLRLIKPAVPRILDFLNRQVNQRLSLGYDIGKGYVVGEEEVSKYLNHMVDHKQILESLKRLSDESRLMVIRDLGMLQREHPGIAIAVKTRQAVRSVLNNVRETITDLKEGGLLDEAEYGRLEHIIDDRVKLLMVAPPYLPPLPPTELLKNIPWVGKNQELIDHLESRAQLVNLDFGNEIMNQGDTSDGIYVVVSGMLKVECRELGQLQEEIQKTGLVPNSEIMSPAHDTTVLRDYIGAGNVVGEVGLLTGRSRDASVQCETAVQAYYIPNEVMSEMMAKFNEGPENLEYLIWRSIGMRVAINVLMDQAQYQSWTQQKIKLYVEKCFMPKLDYKKTFTSGDLLDDVILIQGRAINPHTREVFTAPAYVPRTVHQLGFLTDKKTGVPASQALPKIVALPNADMPQSEIWEMVGYDADAIANKAISTASCNMHSAPGRASRPSLVDSRLSRGVSRTGDRPSMLRVSE
ncbi:sodium/hydrogen exchanger 10-like isoform X2 [Pollicipes pollicipes]|uniref:sodium/hydrogen exchanger 10-like isoform X2 n=1 Tax=Pollicipes pollicipes TaxID=41117 RepID=UPI001884FB38|nr:sodium/hydrogen exchanger 10-like isoform X2 [Pollicipes pollicipes]